MEGAHQKKIIDLNIDPFDYKFIVITKVSMFKDYMDITYVDEASLKFIIQYSKKQINNLSIVVFYGNFNMKRLKFIYKIVINLKRRNKKNWRVLIGHL
jgi:peptidoglycan/xylan/chitin deacetylase (PgdA/CDA1 family)